MGKLKFRLIIVEGLGHSPRRSGSTVFAFKHYPATFQCSPGIWVPALKEEGSREETWLFPLCCLKLTHWKHKTTELISHTNSTQAGKGRFPTLLWTKLNPHQRKSRQRKDPGWTSGSVFGVTSEPAVVEVFPSLSSSSLLEQKEFILLHLHPTITWNISP